ncbi:MAG: DNA-processing protein DprA, partial [Burkholderiales bacterium]
MAVTEGLAAWVRLEQTAGVGPETALKLLSAFGLPENIFSASFSALQKVVPERVAFALTAAPSAQTQALIARTLTWAEQPGNLVLTLADSGYPPLLLDIPAPPMMLYVKGRVELLSSLSLAVVGSRNATAQGIANAEKFSEALSQAGLSTVSGMALGIDSAAHLGSLRHFKHHRDAGSTIAVIGTGIDIVYPARNRDLAHQIAVDGCIVSEYPLGMPAIPANFPRRNRIISGLARGTLVVEAAAQSGSLITARMAAEQGREVFAIPGSIHSPLSKGCHQLIRQGAKLVESAQDILEELGAFIGAHKLPEKNIYPPTTGSVDSALLTAMGFDPVDANTLSMRAGLDAAALSAQLLTLELDGAIESLPGGIY